MLPSDRLEKGFCANVSSLGSKVQMIFLTPTPHEANRTLDRCLAHGTPLTAFDVLVLFVDFDCLWQTGDSCIRVSISVGEGTPSGVLEAV